MKKKAKTKKSSKELLQKQFDFMCDDLNKQALTWQLVNGKEFPWKSSSFSYPPNGHMWFDRLVPMMQEHPDFEVTVKVKYKGASIRFAETQEDYDQIVAMNE